MEYSIAEEVQLIRWKSHVFIHGAQSHDFRRSLLVIALGRRKSRAIYCTVQYAPARLCGGGAPVGSRRGAPAVHAGAGGGGEALRMRPGCVVAVLFSVARW